MAKNKNSKTILGSGYNLKTPGEKITEISIPDDFRKGHFWCFGTIRVGKTRIIEGMVEQDIRKGYSVVVMDPKGDIELFSKIAQIAIEEGREKELILVTPVFPQYSAIINPLSHYYMPEELAGHIVSGVSVGRDPYFFNVAYDISLAIIESLTLLSKNEGKRIEANLNDIKRYVSRKQLESLKQQIDSIDREDLKIDAEQLSRDMERTLENPQDYFNKVSNGLSVALRELTAGNIGQIIGKADENKFIKRLEKDEPVIMVVQLGSLLTRRAAYTVGKVVLSMVQSFVGRKFASGMTVSPPLCIYIDEAQNVMYVGVDELFAKAGGAGVWVHGFCQSVSQLYAELGKDRGNAILDNTNTKVFMRVPDEATAGYVAGHFGKRKVLLPIFNIGGEMSFRDDEEDILKPSDVLNMNPREFYMLTYSGSYQGKTLDVSDRHLDVKFPKVSGWE